MQSEFDLNFLTKIARSEFLPLFQSAHGPKSLVIDDRLFKCLDRLVSNSILRQMEFLKIYRFQNFDPSTCDDWQHCVHRFYLIKPDLNLTKKVINQANFANQKSKTMDGKVKIKMTIVYWPRKTHICLDFIEKQGFYDEIAVEEFNPGFITLSHDVISLELPEFFVSAFLDQTCEWHHSVAHSILKLKILYGDFSTVYCLGRHANDVYKLTQRLISLHERHSTSNSAKTLELNLPKADLFLFDRNLDYVSVFLSCLTYDNLLDETFGVNCGFVEFENEKVANESAKNTKKSILLNDQDPIYIEIRDGHFSYIFQQLRNTGLQIKEKSDKRHQLEKINDMKNFVSKELQILRQQQKHLALHVNAFETILNKKRTLDFSRLLHFECKAINNDDFKSCVEFLEDLMCQQMLKIIPLAFMCLLSITNCGLHQKEYYNLRRQFLQAYGHKYLTLLHNLKKLNVLNEKEHNIGANLIASPQNLASLATMGNKFGNFCKKLSLIPQQNVVLNQPVDPSYVFNGVYTSVICKLICNILQQSFDAAITDEIRNLFGPDVIMNKDNVYGHLLLDSMDNKAGPKVKIFYFLGGVTHAEIAALRLLNKVKFPQYKFIIAASSIINKERFVKSFCQEF